MADTYPIQCGGCGLAVAAKIVSGGTGNVLWLSCPSCDEGSVMTKDGAVYLPAPAGGIVKHLPPDVAGAWREARTAHNVAAYTAAEIMCRKILMHVAVGKAGSDVGKSFLQYVNDLEAGGYLTTGLAPVVDKVRGRGNIANHDLPASTEEDALVTMAITEHLLKSVYELPNI